MKKIRSIYSLGLYVFFVALYALAAMWVWDGYTLGPPNKIGVLVVGMLLLVPVTIILEVHERRGQGYRNDILDAFLDEDEGDGW